jgi:hypothetical protein
MPDKAAIERARRDKSEGKSASTQAGEFIREEIHHIRNGKHGARSSKQAIAIGLSEARRAGVDVPPRRDGSASPKKHPSARHARESAEGDKPRGESSGQRARASLNALKREGHAAASTPALSRHAHWAAAQRTAADRSAAAKKAAHTRAMHSS